MSSLIGMSEAAALALHAMTYIASEDGRISSTRKIASALKVSEAHLSKVLQRLGKAGLIKSIRGPSGGFTFRKEAQSISLLDIYEAIEGTYRAKKCLFDYPRCKGNKCLLGGLLLSVDSTVRSYLANTTLAELSDMSFGS